MQKFRSKQGTSRAVSEEVYKGGQIIDLALLPPCGSTLLLHLSHCKYVACLWKASASANLDIQLCQYGWTSGYKIQGLDEIFPEFYEELLTHGNDNESESDSDDYF